MFLPYPSGPHWERLLGDNQYRSVNGDKLQTEEELDEQTAYFAQSMFERDRSREGNPRLRTLCYAMLCKIVSDETVDSILDSVAETVDAVNAV